MALTTQPLPLAPGSRVLIRGEEWLVRRLERTVSGDDVIIATGLTELVRDKDARFIRAEGLDKNIVVVDPRLTKPVADPSPYHRNTLLHLEALFRSSPPTDSLLHLGHRGAMDVVPYQLEPASRCLQQPRQRFLIADAVGLGKTIECGILLSELIARGRGRRILVLTVKSMLTQFQKEMWARFSIPLVRLDSQTIHSLRAKLPTHHNPFHHYDKTIISIDTIKQDLDYRVFLEQARWDIIVIDEAHNVAERQGSQSSQRSRVAKLLASRSDSLILLSATPHDGKKQSFASILNMLDPTAIKDPENYGPEDIGSLFIRRFKKDIKDQVRGAFPERVVSRHFAEATRHEDKAFTTLASLEFSVIDSKRRTGELLFRTVLEKALLSSPAACLETVAHRVEKLQAHKDVAAYQADIAQLEAFYGDLTAISEHEFSKYQTLLSLLRPGESSMSIGWTGLDTKDRLVIFSERLATVLFLQASLRRDLKLKPDAIAILHGGLSDVEQQSIVEQFGADSSPLRILVASDVASEGINLHHLCHRLIHFDIPWSLLTFQQRNGRVDRYGQQHQPQLHYLMTRSQHLRGDHRVLDILIKKDSQVQENIGDPAEFTGLHTAAEEELKIGKDLESGLTPEQFEAQFQSAVDPEEDWLSALLGQISPEAGVTAAPLATAPVTAQRPSLYRSDFHWAKEAVGYLQATQRGSFGTIECLEDRQEIHFTSEDFHRRLSRLPKEIKPTDGPWVLTADRGRMIAEIAACRKQDARWPQQTLLWEQHPFFHWLTDKILSAFGRQEAPVIALPPGRLAPGQIIILATGILPNRKGQPLIQRWMGVSFRSLKGKNKFQAPEYQILSLEEVIATTQLGQQPIPQAGVADEALQALQPLIPFAVDAVREELRRVRKAFDAEKAPALKAQLDRLTAFRDSRSQQLELDFSSSLDKGLATTLEHRKQQKEAALRSVSAAYDEYVSWIEDSLKTEDNPATKIAAIFLNHP